MVWYGMGWYGKGLDEMGCCRLAEYGVVWYGVHRAVQYGNSVVIVVIMLMLILI